MKLIMKLILPDMFCGTWIAQTSQVKVSKRFKKNPKSEGCKSRHLAACILKNQSQLICCAWHILEPTCKTWEWYIFHHIPVKDGSKPEQTGFMPIPSISIIVLQQKGHQQSCSPRHPNATGITTTIQNYGVYVYIYIYIWIYMTWSKHGTFPYWASL